MSSGLIPLCMLKDLMRPIKKNIDKKFIREVDVFLKLGDSVTILGRTKNRYYIIECNYSNGEIENEISFNRLNPFYRNGLQAYKNAVHTLNFLKESFKL